MDFKVHLPEPSEPVPDDWRRDPGMQGSGSWVVRCGFCKHPWHGLPCNHRTCTCNSANEMLHETKEPDPYGRDDEPPPKELTI